MADDDDLSRPSVRRERHAGTLLALALELPAAETNYHPGRELAHGGMGSVLTARDEKLGRDVAMKVMLRPEASEAERQRFLQEARVLGQLAHPNIVPIHDLATDERGRLFFTMKLVQGATLNEVLRQLQAGDAATLARYPLARLLTIFQKVCDAVAFAHARGIIHRDLKPQNIMVGEFGEVLVMDWGLAKILSDNGVAEGAGRTSVPDAVTPKPVADTTTASAPPPDSGALNSAATDASGSYATLEGAVLGTPNFMSPEQAEGRISELDARADIYSLGAILYALLTLRPPVEGASLAEILANVKRGQISPPSAGNASHSDLRILRRPGDKIVVPQRGSPPPHLPDGRVPAALSAVAMKALRPDRTQRYQDVAALSAEVEAYQGGFATAAENANALTLLRLSIQRHKALTFAAAIIVLLTVGFMAKLLSSEQKATQHAALAELNAKAAVHSDAKAQATLADLRRTAPTFAQLAAQFVSEQKFPEALEKIAVAVALDPANPDHWLLQGDVLQSLFRFAAARDAYRAVLARKPGHPFATENLAVGAAILAATRGTNLPGPELLAKLHAVVKRQDRTAAAIALLRVMGQRRLATLEAAQEALRRCHPGSSPQALSLDDDGLLQIDLFLQPVTDLSPLRGLPISSLKIELTQVTDLKPLTGMPLQELQLQQTAVSDLSPLRGMKLRSLHLGSIAGGCQVRDLSPLKGMPLKQLTLQSTLIDDLSPLAGMPLESLELGAVLPSQALFQGWPLRSLRLHGTPLHDLSVLQGLPLTNLHIHGISAHDFSPLKGLKLQSLEIEMLPVLDLSLVADMPLETLVLRSVSQIAGLETLRRLKLKHLELTGLQTPLDLTLLRDMPLETLRLHGANVTDVRPLAGMTTLRVITLTSSAVKDVSPLAQCRGLTTISLPPNVENLETLRPLPLLHMICRQDRNLIQAAHFWKEFDAERATPK